ncbi:MAG: DUF1080 domain-containing protein [Opitutaceae bacterium]|nr:DUF1080 domain-containing protein [Opitutaceae bacterium]
MITPHSFGLFRIIVKLVALVLVASQLSADQPVHPPEGFRALFNGRNLSGWWGAKTENPREWMALPADKLNAKREASLADIRRHWSVEGDELVNGGAGLYLTSEEFFGDYELLIEYRTVALADSGIYLKGSPQVQIWDTTEAAGKWDIGAKFGSGGLWNNSPGTAGKNPLVLADRAFGEWNQFRIIQCGARTWVWLNDQLVVDGAILENYFDKTRVQPIPARGPIQLQTHGGEIRWRNVFVRNIEPKEANARLSKITPAGFESIFNGRDLNGWDGSTEAYAVRDETIWASPDSGGALFTTESYANFQARLEFKVPSGGNNGLAIRYPGHGNPAYDGMTELQVLDNTGPRYTQLDDRQYHGSAYGMVPAERGYQRSVGEWNYQEVTVVGSTIKVELNGNIILQTDLADVTEYMDDKKHPGKDLATGYFGFAGHKSPVGFRNISIKRLP